MFEIKGIHHHTVIVSDLAEAKHFYCDILGLTIDQTRPQMSFEGLWLTVGQQQIHLMQLPNPDQGINRPKHGGRDRHVALSCLNFSELVKRLDQENIAYTLSQSGRNALFCRDPDDNAIEFIEIK